jgi:hypothetical protein
LNDNAIINGFLAKDGFIICVYKSARSPPYCHSFYSTAIIGNPDSVCPVFSEKIPGHSFELLTLPKSDKCKPKDVRMIGMNELFMTYYKKQL